MLKCRYIDVVVKLLKWYGKFMKTIRIKSQNLKIYLKKQKKKYYAYRLTEIRFNNYILKKKTNSDKIIFYR